MMISLLWDGVPDACLFLALGIGMTGRGVASNWVNSRNTIATYMGGVVVDVSVVE